MNWFTKKNPNGFADNESSIKIIKGKWIQCPSCDKTQYKKDIDKNQSVCPLCNHHFRITARKRLEQFLDSENSFEIGCDLSPVDMLKFYDTKSYADRIDVAQRKTGEKDAMISLFGKLKGKSVVACSFDFQFLGGSMGSVVGEKFIQSVNKSIEENCPLICFTASGGARMQESLYSLMQMTKTSAGLSRLSNKKIPYIVVLTDPTTGGVSASLAMLGDIQIAEPNALIGFAGPSIIKQTVREILPEGFQKSEFLLKTGMLDMIVHRHKLRDEIFSLLNKLSF